MTVLRMNSASDIDRHFAKGRGSGEGADYKPWYLVREYPAKRRSSIMPSELHERDYQLLSPFMRSHCLLALHAGLVTDIRESFPIHPSRTLAIADALGIKHPMVKAGVPEVLRTTFLFTKIDAAGTKVLFARSLPLCDAKGVIDWQKCLPQLEIVRVYWALQNVPWGLSVPQQFNGTLMRNLEFFYEASQLDDVKREVEAYMAFLAEASTLDWAHATVEDAVRAISQGIGKSFETTMNIFKLAGWRKDIAFDMTKGLVHTTKPLPALPKIRTGEQAKKAA